MVLTTGTTFVALEAVTDKTRSGGTAVTEHASCKQEWLFRCRRGT